MRCPQCQFENIPGQERCLRCGAVLQAGAIAGSVNPPRMASWKKPQRTILRWLRIHAALPEVPNIRRVRVPAFLKKITGDDFLGVILSIIPGLAHYIDGKFREIRWFVLGWLLVLLTGVLFYGGAIGFLLLGLAVGLHGWIAFNYAMSKERDKTLARFKTLGFLLVALALLYWGVRSFAFRDFVFGYSNLTIPYQKVKQGDLLLTRRSRVSPDTLIRGALVLGNFREFYGAHAHAGYQRYQTTGQVIALPGEMIQIANGQFFVNGSALDAEKFPVPQWLSGVSIRFTMPEDSCFISVSYQVYGHGVNLTDNIISSACVQKQGDIVAVAVMRWLPVSRRGFLRMGK
jgi:hypothetical protein